MADAMGRMKLEDDRVEVLRQRLDRQSTIMTRMLDDLLDVARIATGKISIQLENIDLRDILRDLVEENEENANNAGIRFEFMISDTPCPVRGDRVRLSQIIDNVLANAIKFTLAKGHVVIRLYAEGGSVLLRIEDSGVGFDRELAERLFQPFVQAKREIDRINGGLGLGLAISRKLAELQDGSLTAESPGSGRGASFTLTLPLVEQAPRVPSVKLEKQKARCIRVLVIEDNKDAADTMGELIGLLGSDVDVAYDGQSALARARATPPELIICDLGLPGAMDGYAVARALRAEPRLHRTRLIAV